MSDMFTDIMATSAAINSSEAADQATKARQAAEENLEGANYNPFLVFEVNDVYLDQTGVGFFGILFGQGKRKVGEVTSKVSIKKTDIAFLEERKDDFGRVYTMIKLEGRCKLNREEIYVAGSMETVQQYINNQ